MKKVFLLSVSLFAVALLFAQSQLVVVSPTAPFVFGINGVTYSQVPNNSIEVKQLEAGCYDVSFNFVNGGVYQTCIYVPQDVKIVYMLKFDSRGIPKLLPVDVVDFDNPSFNMTTYLNQVRALLNNPVLVNINIPSMGTVPVTPGVSPGMNTGVSEMEFQGILNSIRNEDFDAAKLTKAKQIISNRPLTSYQIKRILELFSFESNKLMLAQYAYDYVVDPQNYYVVTDAFEFLSSKNQLLNYIKQKEQGF